MRSREERSFDEGGDSYRADPELDFDHYGRIEGLSRRRPKFTTQDLDDYLRYGEAGPPTPAPDGKN